MRWRSFFLSLFLATGLLAGCGVKPDDTVPTSATDEDRGADEGKTPVARAGGLTLAQGSGELGNADYLEKKSCVFIVRNDTGKPINLVVGEKSCACSGVEIKPTALAPKQTAEVTLHWTPKADQLVNDEVRVTATVQAKEDAKTNVVLEGRGRIRPALFLSLPRGELDFGRVDVADLKQGKELSIEVYTQDDRHKGFTLAATSSNSGINLTPSDPQPLAPERLNSLKAVAGYRLNLQCGEGLPVGRFRETVYLKSNVYPDRVLDVTVLGWVESGAVNVTPDTVPLPENIPLANGYRCPPIEVTLRGESDRTLQFVKAEPAFLRVDVEPVRPNTWRVRVSIPAGEAELRKHVTSEELDNLLSYGFNEGALTFATNHSRMPVLRIPVPGKRLQR